MGFAVFNLSAQDVCLANEGSRENEQIGCLSMCRRMIYQKGSCLIDTQWGSR